MQPAVVSRHWMPRSARRIFARSRVVRSAWRASSVGSRVSQRSARTVEAGMSQKTAYARVTRAADRETRPPERVIRISATIDRQSRKATRLARW